MAHNKGFHYGSSGGGGSSSYGHNNNKGKPYALMLLIAFGAALLGVMVLHKLRERRIYNLLVKDKDDQLLSLHLLYQKERDRTKELRNKNEEMKGKIYALRIQKMEFDRRIVEMQSTMDSLRDEQKVMESAFEEKQNEFRTMQSKAINSEAKEIEALRESLKQKESEIQELKRRLEMPVAIVNPENVTGNGTIAAQDQTKNENKEKEEEYEGDGKSIINEDANKTKLTMFKEEIKKDEKKPGEKGEEAQEDGGADTEDEVVVEDRETKQIREDQREKLTNNTDAGEEYSKMKRWAVESRAAFGAKRKHGRLSRTKGKRWKTIVKNKLMESDDEIMINMGNKKVYRKEKGELKGRVARRVSDEDNAMRDTNTPDKWKAEFLKLDNHEMNDGGRSVVVADNGINTNIHQEKVKPGKMKYADRNEESLGHQNWSGRHISNAQKDGGLSKSDVFHEEPEEIEVSGVQQKEKFVNEGDDDDEEGEENNDDFFKDPQSDVEDDEKEEYKVEIDESEFQPDL